MRSTRPFRDGMTDVRLRRFVTTAGWGYMVASNASTCWEGWDNETSRLYEERGGHYHGSHNHAWLCGGVGEVRRPESSSSCTVGLTQQPSALCSGSTRGSPASDQPPTASRRARSRRTSPRLSGRRQCPRASRRHAGPSGRTGLGTTKTPLRSCRWAFGCPYSLKASSSYRASRPLHRLGLPRD